MKQINPHWYGYVEAYFFSCMGLMRRSSRCCATAWARQMVEFLSKLFPDRDRDGGLWGLALLGARAPQAGPRSEADRAGNT